MAPISATTRSTVADAHACAVYGAGSICSNRASAALRPALGTSIPFVNPALSACEAPICWCACASAPLLDAIAERAINASKAGLSLAHQPSIKHFVRGPIGEEFVLLRDANAAVTLKCRGCPLARGPINLTLQNRLSAPDVYAKAVASLADLLLRPTQDPDYTRTRLLLRDALIAIDGKCLGASYRDIAIIIYGLERVRAEWIGTSRWMKDRICRAYAKGQELRDGGYLNLLRHGVV